MSSSPTPANWSYVKMKVMQKSVVKTPVTGIGDDAVFVATSGIGTGLYVKKGNFAFQIRVFGFPVEEIEAKEKILAENILAKL